MAKTTSDSPKDKDEITFKVRISKTQNPKAHEWAMSLAWGMFPKFVNDILTLYADKGYLLTNDWILENDTKSVELLQRSQTQQVNSDGMQDLLKQMQVMQEQMMFLQRQIHPQQNIPVGFGFPPQGYMHPYMGHPSYPHPQDTLQQQNTQTNPIPSIQEQQSQTIHQQPQTGSIRSHEPIQTNNAVKEDEFAFVLPPIESNSNQEHSSLGGFGGDFSENQNTESNQTNGDSVTTNFDGFQMY